MDIDVIDIKSHMPPADVACAELEIRLESLKHSQVKILKVVHGYGSHGVGGEIKKQMNLLLFKLKKEKKIVDYVNGDRLGEDFIQKNALYEKYPSLILDADLKNYNSGVSIIILKK